jgi:glycosyltransferase involved in cell wall biosynthesis
VKSNSSSERQPLVWMDATTSWREKGALANGTLRVEGSYAAALHKVMGPQLQFCRYSRTSKRFMPMAIPPEPDGANRSQRHRALEQDANGLLSLRKTGRHLERRLRGLWRNSLSWGLQRLDAGMKRPPFADARAGDVLLLAGENWSRYDFAILTRMRREQQIRLAAVCQDLIPLKCPQFFDGESFVARFRRYADFLVGEVDLLIAISNSTSDDLLEHARNCGGLRGRLETIRLGADFDVETAPQRPRELPDLSPRSFVLSVSTIQSRKNFDLLYRLWHRLSEESLADLPRLIIVGRRGFGSADLLWQISRDPLVERSIKVVHHASDAELSWLYRNCLWTLYPSFYEGWGLPVSESLAHGKYCLASDTSSLPEVGQGLIRLLDPLDFRAWHDSVLDLLRSPEILAEHERRIVGNYQPVTWRQSAERLALELRQLLDRQPSAAFQETNLDNATP